MVNITVNKNDLARVLLAIDRVKQVVIALAKSIPEESAKEFADQLRSNITTQKYSFAPLGDWKKGQPNANMFWLWMGTLLKSIHPWRIKESAELVQWFVGLKYGASSISTARAEGPSKSVIKAKKGAVKTGVVVMKGGKRIEVVKQLTPAQIAMRDRLRSVNAERAMARKAAATGVRHIDPAGYVLQRKSSTGTQVSGGKPVSLGHEIKRIKTLSDTSND